MVIGISRSMKKLYKEKDLAIKLRLKGMSYSQIRTKLGVSKSTLSVWLEKYPLSNERIKELRDWNPRRIENSRNTKLKKREDKLGQVYKRAEKEIGSLSTREKFIAGMFLYWGEGTKSARDMVAFTNTDPSMVKFFVNWIILQGVLKSKLKVKLHLYVDMNIKKETLFWSKYLNIPETSFRKPYIKDSKLSSITYKNSYGHGTCSVIYGNSDLHNKIIMSLKYMRSIV